MSGVERPTVSRLRAGAWQGEVALGLWIVGSALTLLAISLFIGRRDADFWMFYESGRVWRGGGEPYTFAHPNLNPPSVVAWLFAPLSLLPYRHAQILWVIAGVVSQVLSLLRIRRALRLSQQDILTVAACLGATHASWLVWFQGQVIWLLLYPATAAWVALREDRKVEAGLWFGAVVAIKPQFAAAALLLPTTVWLAAAASSILLTLAGVMATGWHSWAAWMQLGGGVRYLTWPDNASLLAVAARLETGQLFAETPLGTLGAYLAPIGLAVVATGWWTRRVKPLDSRLGAAVLWAIAVCPLGWFYYAPLALGSLVASWRGSPGDRARLLIAAAPLVALHAFLDTPGAVRSLGNWYAVALMALWWQVVRSGTQQLETGWARRSIRNTTAVRQFPKTYES